MFIVNVKIMNIKKEMVDSVEESVWNLVDVSVCNSVRGSVRGSVWDTVQNLVDVSVRSSVRVSVHNNVESEIKEYEYE